MSPGSPWSELPLVCPACRSPLEAAEGGARCVACPRLYPEHDGILDLRLGSIASPGFDPHYFAFLAESDRRHYWFRARREIIRDAITRVVGDRAKRGLFDVGWERRSPGVPRGLGVPVAGACDAYPEASVPPGEAVRRSPGRRGPPAPFRRRPPLLASSTCSSTSTTSRDAGLLHRSWSREDTSSSPCPPIRSSSTRWTSSPTTAAVIDGRARRKLRGAGFEVKVLTHFMSPARPPAAPGASPGPPVPRPKARPGAPQRRAPRLSRAERGAGAGSERGARRPPPRVAALRILDPRSRRPSARGGRLGPCDASPPPSSP